MDRLQQLLDLSFKNNKIIKSRNMYFPAFLLYFIPAMRSYSFKFRIRTTAFTFFVENTYNLCTISPAVTLR